MDFKEFCKKRYSVRAFKPQPVEKEKIEYILTCAQLAPSACNFQPWTFYVVTDENVKQGIQKSYDRAWFKSAPAYIVVCSKTTQSWKRADGKDFAHVDAAIAAQHICLATVEAGLGTCWVCNFNADILKSALILEKGEEPLAIFPLGYINDENEIAPEKKRKSLAEITRWI